MYSKLMNQRDRRIWTSAVAVHLVAAACLAIPRGTFPQPTRNPSLVLLLDNPRELPDDRVYMVASLPQNVTESPALPQEITRAEAPAGEAAAKPTPTPAQTPEPTPPPPEPPPTPPPPGDREQLMQELAAEREQLRAKLQQQRELAAAMTPSPPPPVARNPESGDSGVGTIRSLDFEGWPKNVVDEMMARYDLRVTQRRVSSGSNQSFLSSAANERGDRFYADRNSRPGVYQVFELSRKCVATMSRLEEAEIKRRGWKPERTRVKEVRFGIVEQEPGKYDIGIIKIVAEELP